MYIIMKFKQTWYSSWVINIKRLAAVILDLDSAAIVVNFEMFKMME